LVICNTQTVNVFIMGWHVQVTSTNVDIATVAPSYHLYDQSEVEDVISRL